MDQEQIEDLKKMVAALNEQVRLIIRAAGDFPAMARNAARVEASANMMVIDLGGSVLEEE